MEITTPAFEEGGRIPARHTCEGEDLSPPLDISGVPSGARTLALVVDDPDAPKGTFVHWLAWNLPPDTRTLGEGASGGLDGTEGVNGFGETGYRGPCPPPGHGEHRYRFTLLALDAHLDVEAGADRETLDRGTEGHVLDVARLTGVFER